MRVVRVVGILLSIAVAAASVWWARPHTPQQEAKPAEPVKTLSLVVAAEPLRYGQKISPAQVKIIEWRGASLPSESFETVESVRIGDDGPYALAAIAEGAPLLKSQITAAGQKPSLSARLGRSEVAVTIPVNTITGVAGFVLPEERVDVLLNRKQDDRRYADIILQNLRVLAVNSIPDAGGGEPVQAKSVTFAAAREDAQKLIVASGLGEISLVLRSPMSESYKPTRSISDLEVVSSGTEPLVAAAAPAAEIAASEPVRPEPVTAAPAPAVPVVVLSSPPPARLKSQVTVVRGLESSVVTLP